MSRWPAIRTPDAIEKYFSEIDRKTARSAPPRAPRQNCTRVFAPPVRLAGGCLLYQFPTPRKAT
jgi:hypothetical protein